MAVMVLASRGGLGDSRPVNTDRKLEEMDENTTREDEATLSRRIPDPAGGTKSPPPTHFCPAHLHIGTGCNCENKKAEPEPLPAGESFGARFLRNAAKLFADLKKHPQTNSGT